MTAIAGHSPFAALWRLLRDPASWMAAVDVFAILTAVALPFSTSLTAIFVVAMLIAWVPFLDLRCLPAIAAPSDRRGADRVLRPGTDRHAVVGRGMGNAVLCGVSDGEAADAAGAVLSFRTFGARRLGRCRLPRVLHASDDDVLGRGLRARPDAQAGGRRLARHLRQELHRSEPGVRAVRGGAGLSGRPAPARGKESGRRWRSARSACASSPTWCSSSCRGLRS